MGKLMLNGKGYGGSGSTASDITYDSTASGNGASTVQSAIDINSEKIDTLNESLFDMIYPVGSIYMSVNNVNPNYLFNGIWEQIKDTFLLSAGDTYSVGSTGGEASHVLTVNEIPSHSHIGLGIDGVYVFGWDVGNLKGTRFDEQLTQTDSTSDRLQTGYVGGSQAHNNMPPYLVVYVWKRIS